MFRTTARSVLDLTSPPRTLHFSANRRRPLSVTRQLIGNDVFNDRFAPPVLQEYIVSELDCLVPTKFEGLVRCAAVAELPVSPDTLVSSYSFVVRKENGVLIHYTAIRRDHLNALCPTAPCN